MTIEWQRTPQGYAAPGFRIRRVGEPGAAWQLEAAAYRLSSRPGAGPSVTRHGTVGEAMRCAKAVAAERRRRARIRGYLIVGTLASGVFAVTASTVTGIAMWVAATLSCYVALRAFVNAIALALGDVWGWTRDDGLSRPPTIADRLMGRWVEALEGPPDWPAADGGSVRVVEPHRVVPLGSDKRSRRP